MFYVLVSKYFFQEQDLLYVMYPIYYAKSEELGIKYKSRII